MKFKATIYTKDSRYHSQIILDSKQDYIDNAAVTTYDLAHEYLKKYILRNGQYALVSK